MVFVVIIHILTNSFKEPLVLEEVNYSFEGPSYTGDVDGSDPRQNIKIYQISFQAQTEGI